MSGDFPEVADRLRRERGYTLRGLAHAATCDPSHLSKLLNGRKTCSEQLARTLDVVLNARGEIIDAAARDRDRSHRPDRDLGGHVTPELVGYFRGRLAGHYTDDMWLGPKILIPIVEVESNLVMQLADEACDSAVRRGLLDAGTAYAALLGWLYQDAGDLTASARWRGITLDTAHRAGDPDLVSYALSNKAMLATDGSNGRTVLDYASAAIADARRLSPKTRVIALQHAAQGHAMLGNRETCARLIDQAAALIPDVDDEHPWGNACRRTPGWTEAQRATCYGKAGDYAGAARLWDEIMGAMPETARRDNAVFNTRLATALARVPDPDRVVDLAAAAADTLRVTGSARLRRELITLPGHARSWRSSGKGRELAEIVASIA